MRPTTCFSDLIRQDSRHRICCTGIGGGKNIIWDRNEYITRQIMQMDKEKDCSVIFTASIPMAFITGIQYDHISRKVQKLIRASLIDTPAGSFRGDWIDGYEETLLAIANKLKLKNNLKRKGAVGIVGYLFDRNEGDHTGNLKELGRILKGLSLDLVSVWLSGSPYAGLHDIEKAEIVISLPYGRSAAKQIARKTGADLLELNLPFGLGNTQDWINTLANRSGRKRQAHSLIKQELGRVVPLVNLLVSKYLTGRRFAVSADPYLAYALTTSLSELGAETDHAVIFGAEQANQNLVSYNRSGFKTLYAPSFREVFDLDTSKTDLFIGNSYYFNLLRTKDNRKPYVELGFPSFYYHCLTTRPFMGFNGQIIFLNRLANSFSR